jgi:hypothetical protein
MSFLDTRRPLYQAIAEQARRSPIAVVFVNINGDDISETGKMVFYGQLGLLEDEEDRDYDDDEFGWDGFTDECTCSEERLFRALEQDERRSSSTIVAYGSEFLAYEDKDPAEEIEIFVRPYIDRMEKIHGVWCVRNEDVNRYVNDNPVVIEYRGRRNDN